VCPMISATCSYHIRLRRLFIYHKVLEIADSLAVNVDYPKRLAWPC
jgi:hypothetical protein